MLLLRRSDVLDLIDLASPGAVAAPAPIAAPALETGQPGDGTLRPGHVKLPAEGFSLPDLEKEIILKALENHGGNQSATARYLGVPRHVLLYRLEKFGA
jgi:two-component system NtrC family response regulator